MALPFIVGSHQCSLTHGPDGRPQVEIILRIRIPLAESLTLFYSRWQINVSSFRSQILEMLKPQWPQSQSGFRRAASLAL